MIRLQNDKCHFVDYLRRILPQITVYKMTFLHFSDDIKPFEVKCGSRLSHKPLDKFMYRYAE